MAEYGLLGPGVAVILVLITYHSLIYPFFLSPLSRIPSAHWSAPISRFWILWIRYTHRENKTLHAAHCRLGPVIRVGPNELSINDIDSVRTVYQGGFEKPVWYSIYNNYGVPCMFSSRSAAEHAVRKRMISHIYSKSYIHSSPAAAAQAQVILYDRLLPILERSIEEDCAESTTNRGIDVYSLFMGATMDFIAAYIFGLKHGTNFLGDKEYRNHFLDLYRARNNYGFFDQELPELTRLCRRVGIPLCPRWADKANRDLEEWCRRLCLRMERYLDAGRYQPDEKADEPVVWNSLVNGLKNEETKHGPSSILYPTALSNLELSISSELLDHVLAGQETAGLTLTYLTWRLSQSPELQSRLRKELLTLSPNMRMTKSGTPASFPDPKQLDTLPFLDAVVTETLRLHAPLPGAQPRQTPDSGCRIGQYALPGGVRVAAMPYMLHRNETIFPEPEKWDPERWLAPVRGPDDEEQRRQMNRHFWAFSSGGRMCIGSNFALHEIKLTITAIYTNFKSYIVDDTGMENQTDGYGGRPEKEQLILRFEKLVD